MTGAPPRVLVVAAGADPAADPTGDPTADPTGVALAHALREAGAEVIVHSAAGGPRDSGAGVALAQVAAQEDVQAVGLSAAVGYDRCADLVAALADLGAGRSGGWHVRVFVVGALPSAQAARLVALGVGLVPAVDQVADHLARWALARWTADEPPTDHGR